MEYQIRRATAEDAEAVVHMHTQAHEECYGHLLPREFFAARRSSIPGRVQKRLLFLASAEPLFIAMDAGNEIVGFADAGPGRDEDPPHKLELYSLYTLKGTHGTGLGAELLKAAIKDSPAYLWVLEANPRARAFYAKNGFRPDGKRKLLSADWCGLPEMRLVRPDALRGTPSRHG